MPRIKIKEERFDAFRQCANHFDWKFKEDGDQSLVPWLLDFKLCKQGMNKIVKPLVIREYDDLEFVSVFDYIYTISSGNASHTFKQTVYFRYSKQIALPHFVMIPEKWHHRIGTYFGMQDIDFVEYPKFSKNYLLQGHDEDYIRYHFDQPAMIRFFDQQNFYSLEGVNYLMILYVHNKLLPAQEIIKLVNIGNTLHNHFRDKTPVIALPEGLDFVGTE